MALLARDEWLRLTQATAWTPSYVKVSEMFPEALAGSAVGSPQAWETYNQDDCQSYGDYVRSQRDKDIAALSVKAALERSKMLDEADAGWRSILKLHYGAVALTEYRAQAAQARMARFGRGAGIRNAAVRGMLETNRHAQLQLIFAQALSYDEGQDRRKKTLHGDQWFARAVRAMSDDLFLGRDAVGTAIMQSFVLDWGFARPRLEDVGAAGRRSGDYAFAFLAASLGASGSRHREIGRSMLQALIADGKVEEAQRKVDIAIARAWRILAVLSGPSMDYYGPLEHRSRSFREFVLLVVLEPLEAALVELGLQRPWYWNQLLLEAEHLHHAYHLAIWYWRQTVWWNPAAGISPAERDWLETKYPGWNASYGRCWDVIVENLLNGTPERTFGDTLPMICDMSQLPICGIPGDAWRVTDYTHEHNGRIYHFGSKIDRWLFQQDPVRYRDHMTLIDQYVGRSGEGSGLDTVQRYMRMEAGEVSDDAHSFAWVAKYRGAPVGRPVDG
jgi:toluene monooxygenase system protein A